MDFDSLFIMLGLVLAALIALPIIALIRTARIGQLERRLAGVEAALRRVMEQQQAPPVTAARPPEVAREPVAPAQPIAEPPPAAEPVSASGPVPSQQAVFAPAPPVRPAASSSTAPASSRGIEEIIGGRWLGWIAIGLILFAAAFFLKYAFENEWIGPLGRVMIGVLVGLVFVWAGWQRHQAGWRYFARTLTGGGLTLIYLSAYASFGFYQLLDQTTAFAVLALIVLQGYLLALAYNSSAIAVVSQVGGFLVPVLLSTGQDRYGILFSYIAVLNAGVVLLSFMRRWHWIGSLSFVFTHLLFWGWHASHYHPEKLTPALLFQIAVFALFLLGDIAPQVRGRAPTLEQWGRLFVNPFVFFATAYALLEDDYSDWMGAFALLMALLYAGLARAGMSAQGGDRRTLLISITVALTFVTLAIPIQLESNWITLGWGVQGAVLTWLSLRMRSSNLRLFAGIVFGLALFQHLANDTPWHGRLLFTPVANRYFLGALALVGLLALAAHLARPADRSFAVAALLSALALFWLAISVETYTYSDALVSALPGEREWDQVRQIRWFGQSVLSVLWSVYAAGLVAAGFRSKWSVLRWSGLSLFGLTLAKVILVDMSQLEQFYRIVAFLALGLLLLGVAWGYQRITRKEQAG